MLTCFFTPEPVSDYAAAIASNTRAFAAWFGSMLENGVYLPPSQFEAMFVSAAHKESDIDATVSASREAFARAAALMDSPPTRR